MKRFSKFLFAAVLGSFFSASQAQELTLLDITLVFPQQEITLPLTTHPELWRSEKVLPSLPSLSKADWKTWWQDQDFAALHQSQPKIEMLAVKQWLMTINGESELEPDFLALETLLNQALAQQIDHVVVPYSRPTIAKAEFSAENSSPAHLLALGRSSLAGSSAARRKNIEVAVQKFDNTVIRPGKVFSFNRLLESVAPEQGFVPELVIKGNQTVKELGGGVCQLSTSVFRAAYQAGLPILSRKAHSYAVPYYRPIGLDAAIYLGGADLRFRNDTDAPITLRTWIDEQEVLQVALYGRSDGRVVALQGPQVSRFKTAPAPIIFQTENLPVGHWQEVNEQQHGFSTRWEREITYADGSSARDSLVSNYRAWPARWQQGTELSLAALD